MQNGLLRRLGIAPGGVFLTPSDATLQTLTWTPAQRALAELTGIEAGGATIPAATMLWTDGTPMTWSDGTYMLWSAS